MKFRTKRHMEDITLPSHGSFQSLASICCTSEGGVLLESRAANCCSFRKCGPLPRGFCNKVPAFTVKDDRVNSVSSTFQPNPDRRRSSAASGEVSSAGGVCLLRVTLHYTLAAFVCLFVEGYIAMHRQLAVFDFAHYITPSLPPWQGTKSDGLSIYNETCELEPKTRRA